MSRNIIVCCDGTNNQFGVCNTSVVRLAGFLTRDPVRQIVYYDPGIGTLPDPRVLTRIGKRLSRWKELAFGSDLRDKVVTAYAHLMEVCEPGDKIFLFGFSRGAYTVRVLAGMLHAVGLLPAGNTQLLPYAMELFRSVRHTSHGAYWRLLDQFRATFARPVPDRKDNRFPTHFLGVWDTVSSVGWAWDPARYPYTAHNPSVKIARHAVSLDERRWFFRQNLYSAATSSGGVALPDQNVSEVWFPGVHSDVGGGYPEEDGGLWREAFEWMIEGARQAGALFDTARLDSVCHVASTPAWAEAKHESLHGPLWWAAEFFPKRVYDGSTKRYRLAIGRGRHRYVRTGALLHPALLKRLQGDVSYVPPNLTSSFISKIKTMASVEGPVSYNPCEHNSKGDGAA